MITTNQAQQLLSGGGNVVDPTGKKIGGIGQVFLDDQTGKPEWVTVKTGMFGGAESFVPIRAAEIVGEDVRVPYAKDDVKDAPRVANSEDHLSRSEEDELYRHYGISDTNTDTNSNTDTTSNSAVPGPGSEQRSAGTVGRDASGHSTDEAMTRSEEQLHVSKEKVSGGKARLRKYVVTENVTQTVPVSHEEVRVEREPITEANRGDAAVGGDITEDVQEVNLTEERVRVEKETVPVEKVRMNTETVTEDQQVTEEVRKEQIDSDTSDVTRDATQGRR